MDVAIMGAGLSGLACAITLERQGVAAAVFEKRSQVGDRFVNGEIFFNGFSRPVTDAIAYLADQHHIYLRPVSNIRTVVLHSPKEKATLSGNLGFVTLRGRDEDSLEKQLERQLQTKINFDSIYTYEQLLHDFTHVVVATGDAAYASKIQGFQEDLTVTLKGATVTGEFDRYCVQAWLNNQYAPQGYGYLIPLSEQEANVVIGYPDYEKNRKRDINALWNAFYHEVCLDLGQELRVTDRFEVTRYMMGRCRYPRIGNSYFVGNCFGALMPALGFGQFTSLMSGIYAGQSLLGQAPYEQLTKQLRDSYDNSLVLRRILEKAGDSGYDFMVKRLGGSAANQMVNLPRIDYFKIASHLLRPFVLNKHRVR